MYFLLMPSDMHKNFIIYLLFSCHLITHIPLHFWLIFNDKLKFYASPTEMVQLLGTPTEALLLCQTRGLKFSRHPVESATTGLMDLSNAPATLFSMHIVTRDLGCQHLYICRKLLVDIK